jgi:hypothetical protein
MAHLAASEGEVGRNHTFQFRKRIVRMCTVTSQTPKGKCASQAVGNYKFPLSWTRHRQPLSCFEQNRIGYLAFLEKETSMPREKASCIQKEATILRSERRSKPLNPSYAHHGMPGVQKRYHGLTMTPTSDRPKILQLLCNARRCYCESHVASEIERECL